MTYRTLLSLLLVGSLNAACVTYVPAQAPTTQAGSVERAGQLIHQVSDPNLMPAIYGDCRLESSGVNATYINGEQTVTARASNQCQGVTYRKNGVTLPTNPNESPKP